MARFVKEVGRNYNQFTPEDGPGSGSVSSVALTAPTGFTVTGSPVTTSGTLALAFTTGYGIPPLMTGNSGRFLTTNGTTMSWVNIAGTDVTGAAISTSNDTNILITASGNTTNSLLRTMTLTAGWTGQLSVARGGTGAGTLTGVVIGNATSNMTAVSGTAGQFLRRNTANTAYEFRTLQGGDIAGSELTFANDTNVTMTLGGTPASSLLQPVSINLGWTGQLAVSRGGTGASTLTGVLIGNGTSAVTAITGTAGQILRRNTGNTAYEFWSANYLVNPMTLEGSIIYATTGGTPAELFANNTSTNKFLRSVNGTAPTWETITGFLTGSGTTNYIAKWTPSGTVLGNSQIYDNGTNVGVGTPAPAYKFVVSNSSTIGMEFDPGTIVSGRNRLISYNRSTSVYNDFEVYANNVILSPSANVGIGTATPTHKLEVVGVVSAGNASATEGSIILQDNYGLGHLTNLCSNRSVGNPVLTYGLTTSTSTSNAFVSATSIDIPRGALSVAGDLTFRSAASAIVSIGSSVTMTERFTITNGGQMVLPMYTSSSSMPGTAAGVLAFNSIGSIITIAAPSAASSGTYTPTWTGLTNVDSITAYSCQYLRVGDTVTVSGYVGINATVDNTPTTAQLTVPVNSSLNTISYCCGVGVQDNGGATGSILGLGSNTAQFEFSPLVDTMVYYSFHFTYRIV